MTAPTVHHDRVRTAIVAALGFVPAESVVVMPWPPSDTAPVVLRIDIRDCALADMRASLSRTMAAQLRRHEVRHAVVAAWTTDSALALEAQQALVADLSGAGITMRACHIDHGSGSVPVEVTPQMRTSATRATSRWRAKRDDNVRDWRSASWTLWCGALATTIATGQTPTPPTLGKLSAALRDVCVRDAVVVSMIPGGFDAGTDLIDGVESGSVDACLSAMTDVPGARQPDPETVDAVIALCRQAFALASTARRAPWATVAAIAHWWAGRFEQARLHVDAALNADPQYRLATLIDEVLTHEVTPGWMRQSGYNPR